MEETISLGELFEILRKRWLLILATTLAGFALAAGVTFFLITPKYSSSAEMIVQSKAENTNTNLQDVNANVLLINTYKDMILGDVVINDVQRELEQNYGQSLTKGELKSVISVNQSQNSQMFQIVATVDNPDHATDIANVTAQVFQSKATDVLNVNKVTITSVAQSNPTPVSPNNMLNVVIGGLLGLMIGVGLAFLLELLDKTVKDERFVTEELGLPILGDVNEMTKKELENGRMFQPAEVETIETTEQRESRRSRKRV